MDLALCNHILCSNFIETIDSTAFVVDTNEPYQRALAYIVFRGLKIKKLCLETKVPFESHGKLNTSETTSLICNGYENQTMSEGDALALIKACHKLTEISFSYVRWFTEDTLFKIDAEQLKQFEKIDILESYASAETLTHIGQHYIHLHTLSLQFSYWDAKVLEPLLIKIIEQNPQLTDIHFEECELSTALLQVITKGCPNLVDLTIFYGRGVDICAIVELIQKCPKLENFFMGNCDRTAFEYSHKKGGKKTLKILSADVISISCRYANEMKHPWAMFAAAVAADDTDTTEKNKTEDKNNLREFLQLNKGFSTIYIGDLQSLVTSDMLLSIAANNPDLETLRLRDGGQNEFSAQSLRQVLTSCRKLRVLTVSSLSQLSDEEIKEVFQLPSHSLVTSLSILCTSSISTETVKNILQSN